MATLQARHECPDCMFVSDAEHIVVTKEQQSQARLTFWRAMRISFFSHHAERYVVPVGRFVRPGWTGHHMHYLFECWWCEALRVDYPHGHTLYLSCPECDRKLWLFAAHFYAETGQEQPPSWREELRMLWALARRA